MCHMFYLGPMHSYKYKRFVKQIFYIINVNLYYNILLFNSEQIMHKYFIFKSSFILMFSDQYSKHHALFRFFCNSMFYDLTWALLTFYVALYQSYLRIKLTQLHWRTNHNCWNVKPWRTDGRTVRQTEIQTDAREKTIRMANLNLWLKWAR